MNDDLQAWKKSQHDAEMRAVKDLQRLAAKIETQGQCFERMVAASLQLAIDWHRHCRMIEKAKHDGFATLALRPATDILNDISLFLTLETINDRKRDDARLVRHVRRIRDAIEAAKCDHPTSAMRELEDIRDTAPKALRVAEANGLSTQDALLYFDSPVSDWTHCMLRKHADPAFPIRGDDGWPCLEGWLRAAGRALVALRREDQRGRPASAVKKDAVRTIKDAFRDISRGPLLTIATDTSSERPGIPVRHGCFALIHGIQRIFDIDLVTDRSANRMKHISNS